MGWWGSVGGGWGPAFDTVNKLERKRALSDARKVRWKAKMTDDERNEFNAKSIQCSKEESRVTDDDGRR